MGLLGIMTVGFDEGSARALQGKLASEFGQDIALIGATGKKDYTVGQILEDGPGASVFGASDPMIVMLLGFDDHQVKTILNLIPREERPIFCGLTMDNIKWTLDNLVEHLMEEKRYWESQGK